MLGFINNQHFQGGLNYPRSHYKDNFSIKELPNPEFVSLVLTDNSTSKYKVLVKNAEEVNFGQTIAVGDNDFFPPIHAPIVGKVAGVSNVYISPDGHLKKVISIAQKNETASPLKINAANIDGHSNDELIKKIHEAGIVSELFPFLSYSSKLLFWQEKKISKILVKAFDHEFLVSSTRSLLCLKPDMIIDGLAIINQILNPDEIFILIDSKSNVSIKSIEENIKAKGILNCKIIPKPIKYPMLGNSFDYNISRMQMLLQGKAAQSDTIALIDIRTIYWIAEAVLLNKPRVDSVITIAGDDFPPTNISVALGTPFKHIIDCLNLDIKDRHIITNSLLSGTCHFTVDFPIENNTTAIFIKKQANIKELGCINCGFCVTVCPVNLLPFNFVRWVKNGKFDKLPSENIQKCLECGCCSYICPSLIPIMEFILIGKNQSLDKK